MKKFKAAYISLMAMIALLLSAVFIFAASADGAETSETDKKVYYELTLSNGKQSVYEQMDFKTLMDTYAPKEIKCFSDLSVTANFSTSRSVSINLNGNAFKQEGGRIGMNNSSNITVYGGKIVHSGSATFLFTVNSSAKLTIKDCTVEATKHTLVDMRGAALTLTNVTVTSSPSDTAAAFILLNNDSKSGLVTFDGLKYENAKQPLIKIARTAGNISKHVVVKNTVFNTDKSLIYFNDKATALPDESVTTDIRFEGDTQLSFGAFLGNEGSLDSTTYTFAPGVKLSRLPEFEKGKVVLDGAEGIAPIENGVYKYEVMKVVPLPIRAQFALTLYTDFTLNLGLSEGDEDKIVSVKVGEVELKPVHSGGHLIYAIGGIAPQNAAEKQKIAITIEIYGIKMTKTIEYSVIDYANALLNSAYSDDSKEMVCRAVDYVAAVCDYLKIDIPASVAELLASDAYKAISNAENLTSVPESSINVGALKPIVRAAGLEIGTSIKFRFYLQQNIGSGELKVSSRTQKATYAVEDSLIDGKDYFDVDMRAFDLYDGAVVITYGGNTGSYDFKSYANSDDVKNSSDEKLANVILALYNYLREANEYVKVADNERYDYANDGDGSLKVLCIGNSYTLDTTYHVSHMLEDLGIDNYELGRLYIANCSVQRHFANLTEDESITGKVETYAYYLDNAEGSVINRNHTIKDAILSENWDFIVFQHVSDGELVAENGDVEYYGKLVNEVRKYCPNSTFVWNMTWAREQAYEIQIAKYQSIVENTKKYYTADGEVSFFNPIGTAIQNARSSYLGDTMNRDGYHLNHRMGCYTAGLTFIGSITGIDVSRVSWRPDGDEQMSLTEQKIAIESAVNALKNPFAVTESEYTEELEDFTPSASVVLKDGKSATVTYTVDDGVYDTAEFCASVLNEYENLKFTFALIPEKYVKLETAYDDKLEKDVYVFDEAGKYTYTVKYYQGTPVYLSWKNLLDS